MIILPFEFGHIIIHVFVNNCLAAGEDLIIANAFAVTVIDRISFLEEKMLIF
jgi:hypothetical protein